MLLLKFLPAELYYSTAPGNMWNKSEETTNGEVNQSGNKESQWILKFVLEVVA